MANEQQQTRGSEESVPESGRQGKEIARPGQTTPEHHPSFRSSSPFSMMRRMSEAMDRMFDDFLARGFTGAPPAEVAWPERSGANWWPELEVSRRGNKMVVQADLPGLKKEDVKVEVKDDELRISGERTATREREDRGYYRSERSYGSFYRTVRLPRGTKADSATATFENGVLHVEIEAPSETAEGRRIEVR